MRIVIRTEVTSISLSNTKTLKASMTLGAPIIHDNRTGQSCTTFKTRSHLIIHQYIHISRKAWKIDNVFTNKHVYGRNATTPNTELSQLVVSRSKRYNPKTTSRSKALQPVSIEYIYCTTRNIYILTWGSLGKFNKSNTLHTFIFLFNAERKQKQSRQIYSCMSVLINILCLLQYHVCH